MLRMPNYVYMRGAQPLLQWRGGVPPRPIRAADNVALGLGITMVPGGPEAIQDSLTHLPDLSDPIVQSFALGAAAGALLSYFFLGRGKR